MSKKLLARLLALTLCASLVIQPVTAYAATEGEEEGEAQETVVDEPEPEPINKVNWIRSDEISSSIETSYIAGPALPEITFGDLDPDLTYFWEGWVKRNNLFESQWDLVPKDRAMLSGVYRYYVTVTLDPDVPSYYQLDPEFKLSVNEVNWNPINIHIEDDEVQYITFSSPDITVAEKPGTEIINHDNAYWDVEKNYVEGDKIPEVAISSDNDKMQYIPLFWVKKDPLSGKWYHDRDNPNFEAGEYKIDIRVRLASDVDQEYTKLARNFELTLNGEACELTFRMFRAYEETVQYFNFYSPIITVKEKEPELRTISSDTVTTNLQNFYVEGQDVPDVQINSSESALDYSVIAWIKDNDAWGYEKPTFEEGHYRVFVAVSIKDDYKNTCRLDPNFRPNVDGTEWDFERAETDEAGNTQTIYFLSPPYYAEKAKTEIKTINAESSIANVLKIGERYKSPWFYDKNRVTDFMFVYWEKKVDGEWKDAVLLDEELITEGSYRCRVIATIREDARHDYKYLPDTTLLVDGQPWSFKRVENRLPDGDYIGITFESPEFVLEESKGEWETVGVGSRVYRYKNGELAKGMVDVEGVTCFFDIRTGKLVRDQFVEFKGDRYFVDSNGAVVKDTLMTKWGATYLCTESGALPKQGILDYKDDSYYANNNGTIKKDALIQTPEGLVYAQPSGKLAKDTMIIKWNKKYFFDENGFARIGFVEYKGNLYYTEESGAALTGVCFRTVEGIRYYFKSGGVIARSETLQIWGTYYVFDDDGHIIDMWRESRLARESCAPDSGLLQQTNSCPNPCASSRSV